jgi:uncharacterized protein YjbI with pentapeptide repeats
MRSRLPTRRQVLWTVGIGSLLVALAVFIFLGYYHEWEWTGFPPKRLFDWIQILVIPVAVAVGTFVLNRAAKRRDDDAEQARKDREEKAQQAQREREEQLQHQRTEDATLQAYLDYMSGMLTDPDRPLRRAALGDNLSVAARAQTLTALGRLQDGERKGSAIQFLDEAGLINNRPVISLRSADLRGADLYGANLRGAVVRGAKLQEAHLQGADLRGADLHGAHLQEANLQGANLQNANLQDAILWDAHLWDASLQGANLLEADLQGANLHQATLKEADLQEANLTYAEVSKEQLATALSLEGATMPDGSIHH